ncbi:MinD/ParA family ATP-binding protein [Corynebacterium ulceribovis]|uniref:MinD/ParA family ATP-binding protein n=1 Tax=Corynebacterium ulceribovis TaxID=487732 RepID=UPI0003A023CA|nr:MinD/ParA family protein [Corynebacterium ulceribovis]
MSISIPNQPIRTAPPVHSTATAQAVAPVLTPVDLSPTKPRNNRAKAETTTAPPTTAEVFPTGHSAPQATGIGQLADALQPKITPKSGWRSIVYRSTGGRINPGESKKQQRQRDIYQRIRQHISGDYRVAVLSLKGGVGKTTTTFGLGATFATLRGDRVIAIDANPDFGTLAQRLGSAVANPANPTVRDLLSADDTSRYPQVRAFTSQDATRLEVLASEQDPSTAQAFNAADYAQAMGIVRHHYNLILTDCGTGLMHSAMTGVLELANCLVLVTTPSLDGANSAWATLDWLAAHGHAGLVSQTVVVVNHLRAKDELTDAQVHDVFGQRCRAVVPVPFDPHLARGAEIDLAAMKPATQEAYRQLAAYVADDFAQPSGRRHRMA